MWAVRRPLSPEGADLKLLMMELGKQITAGPPWSGQTGIYRGRLGEKRNWGTRQSVWGFWGALICSGAFFAVVGLFFLLVGFFVWFFGLFWWGGGVCWFCWGFFCSPNFYFYFLITSISFSTLCLTVSPLDLGSFCFFLLRGACTVWAEHLLCPRTK